MPAIRTLGTTIRITSRVVRAMVTGVVALGRFTWRGVLAARQRGTSGESRLTRLFDLHAVSCAGDTLLVIGLVNAMLFEVPAEGATTRTALCLFATMAPFALFAPLLGPAMDRAKYGRRCVLTATMVGRAVLAYLASERIGGFTPFAAACGVFALSRIYGVARCALIPRVAPEPLGLSRARARVSFFGLLAGTVAILVGLVALIFGSQWPLVVATAVFLLGTVPALRLPLRGETDPPEAVPAPYRRLGHATVASGVKGTGLLSERAIVSSLLGSLSLRLMYGFLIVYLALAIRSDRLPDELLRWVLSQRVALAAVAGACAIGSFVVTSVGTFVRIRQAALVQAASTIVATVAATVAVVRPGLVPVLFLCLAMAIASGLATFALDSVIEERIDERARVSAFAFADTLATLVWLFGCALGLIPLNGRWGLAIAAGMALLAATRSVLAVFVQRAERKAKAKAKVQQGTARKPNGVDTPTPQQPQRVSTRRKAAARQRTEPPPQRLPDWVGSNDLGEDHGDDPDDLTAQAPRFHLYRPSGLGDQSSGLGGGDAV